MLSVCNGWPLVTAVLDNQHLDEYLICMSHRTCTYQNMRFNGMNLTNITRNICYSLLFHNANGIICICIWPVFFLSWWCGSLFYLWFPLSLQVPSSPPPLAAPIARRLSVSASVAGEEGLMSCVLPEELIVEILSERLQVSYNDQKSLHCIWCV